MISGRAEGQRGGVRETEETEEFTGSIQCDIRTEEVPPQHAQYLYYTVET